MSFCIYKVHPLILESFSCTVILAHRGSLQQEVGRREVQTVESHSLQDHAAPVPPILSTARYASLSDVWMTSRSLWTTKLYLTMTVSSYASQEPVKHCIMYYSESQTGMLLYRNCTMSFWLHNIRHYTGSYREFPAGGWEEWGVAASVVGLS